MAVIVPSTGVFLSTDGGRTWNNVFAHRGPVSLVLSATAVYVGTDSTAGQMKGVYASFDRGKTWVSEGLNDAKITELMAQPGSNGDTVYALPASSLIQSANISAPASSQAPTTPMPAPVTAPASTPANTVVFTIGSQTYTVNGQAQTMDVPPFIDETGRTYIPVRYLAEALGVPASGIEWNASTGGVTLHGMVGSRSITIMLAIGNYDMRVTNGPGLNGVRNGETMSMDTAPATGGRCCQPGGWHRNWATVSTGTRPSSRWS